MSLSMRQSLPPDTFPPLYNVNHVPIDLDDVELVEVSSIIDASSSQSSEHVVIKIKFPEEPMPGLQDLIPDPDGKFRCNWKDCGCFFENEKGRSGASNLQCVLSNTSNGSFLLTVQQEASSHTHQTCSVPHCNLPQ